MISDGLWRRRFGADPELLNKTITLNGENYTVVGIMPRGFDFGRELGRTTDLWAPIAFTPQLHTCSKGGQSGPDGRPSP